MIKIDSHQHFWKIGHQDYGWLTDELEVLYKDYLPNDLKPYLRNHEIDQTIVVQASPTIKETEFLLDLFHQNEFIAGVVGWLDFESDSFKNDYQRLKNDIGFIGVRPMLEDIKDNRWILRPKVMKNIEILLADEFPIDLLINSDHFTVILELMKYYPNLNVVINHAAKPNISEGITPYWKEFMDEMSLYKNVMCKISGLITETDSEHWIQEDFTPFTKHLLKAFGADRLMFGSDWPVCLLSGSYRDTYKVTRGMDLSKEDFNLLLGDNASRFYKISKRKVFNTNNQI